MLLAPVIFSTVSSAGVGSSMPTWRSRLVHGLELVLTAEHQGVEVVEGPAQALDVAMIPGWGQQEPQHRQVERHGVDGEFLDIELASPVAIPRPFQCRDRGLRGPHSDQKFEPGRRDLLGSSLEVLARLANCMRRPG